MTTNGSTNGNGNGTLYSQILKIGGPIAVVAVMLVSGTLYILNLLIKDMILSNRSMHMEINKTLGSLLSETEDGNDILRDIANGRLTFKPQITP